MPVQNGAFPTTTSYCWDQQQARLEPWAPTARVWHPNCREDAPQPVLKTHSLAAAPAARRDLLKVPSKQIYNRSVLLKASTILFLL